MILKSNVESRADAIEDSLQALHNELKTGDGLSHKKWREEEGQADTDRGAGTLAGTLPSASVGRRTFRVFSAEPRRGGGGGGGSDVLPATVVGLPALVGQKAPHTHADALLRLVPASQQLRLRVVCPSSTPRTLNCSVTFGRCWMRPRTRSRCRTVHRPNLPLSLPGRSGWHVEARPFGRCARRPGRCFGHAWVTRRCCRSCSPSTVAILAKPFWLKGTQRVKSSVGESVGAPRARVSARPRRAAISRRRRCWWRCA